MRILLAEDEKRLSKAIVEILKRSNYIADAVYNGEDALEYIRTGDYDAAILDIMMPKMDGVTVLRQLRKEGINIPILLLTAKSEIEDRVTGLDAGADDYLTKPFDYKELLARLRAMLRRKDAGIQSVYKLADLELSPVTYELSSPEGSCRLSAREYQMMEVFMANPHVVISTERFLEKIWGYESDSDVNIVWVYISNLRKKLNKLNSSVQIKATRYVGYSLEVGDDKEAKD